MDNKLINAVIQLASKEEKAGKFGPTAKIKDEKGLTYTVYKTKKDGTISVAWEQLQKLTVGDMVQVSFAEEVVNHPEHGNYTARTVRAFDSDIGNGMANSSAQQKSINGEANRGQSGHSKDDAFWERQAYEKCTSLWIASMIRVGETSKSTIEAAIESGYFWKLFQAIKADGAKRFSATPNSVANLEPELPTIQVDEDLAADVPY